MENAMESYYLRHHVGAVLAKGIAETVVAQPANPQEHLALYLLHHLQEEERRANTISRQKKIAMVERDWAADCAAREKAASERISRGIARFRARMAARKKEEAALQEQYDEAAGEADDLLEQEEAAREEADEQAGSRRDAIAEEEEAATANATAAADGEGGAAAAPGGLTPYERLQELQETLAEQRSDFYRAQRFMLELQKSQVGALKDTLLGSKDRVRMAKAAVGSIRDNAAIDEMADEERDWRLQAKKEAQQFSAAAEQLAAVAAAHRSHEHISVHHAIYRALRVICYILFDATPKATDTPEKVAVMIKPTVVAAALRAFNPVAQYDRARPLKLERNLPDGGGSNDDDETNHNNNDEDEEEAAESFPMPQTKTRQMRRGFRVMRALLSDSSYHCQVNPTDFFDEEYFEDAEEEEEGEGEGEKEAGSGPAEADIELAAIKQQVADAEAAKKALTEIRESVLAQIKSRGGVVLWAIVTYLDAALQFRQTRDAVIAMRRDLGLDTTDPSHPVMALAGEAPEDDDEEDPTNDENVLDEDGMPDAAEIARVQARIGVDEDEALVKIWEQKDERVKKTLEMKAEAFRRAAEADGEDEEGDEDDDDAAA